MAAISIIIPTFNRATIIPKTIESVLLQSFHDWECLIVDDHSTDDTKEIVLEYCRKDKRFRYLTNTHKKGAQGARNTGLYVSCAEWVMFFDSDNVMHPDLLDTMFEELDDSVDVCHCFSNVVDCSTGNVIDKSERIVSGRIHDDLFNGLTYVDFNQEIIRREKMIEIGGLDEDCPSLQEFDTNIRLSEIATYHTVPKVLIDYYYGGRETISGNIKKQVLGKYYNLCKFKKMWIADKKNADRMIYETIEKLRHVDSVRFRIRYAVKIAFAYPEMTPFYLRKFIRKLMKSTNRHDA